MFNEKIKSRLNHPIKSPSCKLLLFFFHWMIFLIRTLIMQNKKKIQHDDCNGGGVQENKGSDGEAWVDIVSG
jgi:hypothetical protein